MKFTLPIIESHAPPKPKKGQPCNGCGFCCAAELCDLAIDRGFQSAPCPAMEFFSGRFWCGLASNPMRYIPGVKEFAVEAIRALVADGLGFGHGCDTDDPDEDGCLPARTEFTA